jgi:DNA primase
MSKSSLSYNVESFLDRECIDYKLVGGKSGQQANLRECPFCGGRKWKVYINTETGLGNCWHGDCEQGFNFVRFASQFLDLAWRDTLNYLERFEDWIPPTKAESKASVVGELIIPESIELPTAKGENLKYLNDRGVNADLAREFGLRFCKQGRFYVTSEIYQTYDNRIIIPIFDLNGELVSFQGRDITGIAEKKYLFPSGYASTGSYFYRENVALGRDTLLIGEGVFDAISLFKVFRDQEFCSVASFGKTIGAQQLVKLEQFKQKGLKKVIMCWDAERKALHSAIGESFKIRGLGIETDLVVLPRDKDPNEISEGDLKKAVDSRIKLTNLTSLKCILDVNSGKIFRREK